MTLAAAGLLVLALSLLGTETALASEGAAPITAILASASGSTRAAIAAVIAFAVVIGLLVASRLLNKPRE
jgi:hypothetical protein